MSILETLTNKGGNEIASELIEGGDFEKALEYIKKIPSKKKQLVTIFAGLIRYVVAQRYTEIKITGDRQKYERFQNSMNPKTMNYILYKDPETGKIEGYKKLLKGASGLIKKIPNNNILFAYIKDLNFN